LATSSLFCNGSVSIISRLISTNVDTSLSMGVSTATVSTATASTVTASAMQEFLFLLPFGRPLFLFSPSISDEAAGLDELSVLSWADSESGPPHKRRHSAQRRSSVALSTTKVQNFDRKKIWCQCCTTFFRHRSSKKLILGEMVCLQKVNFLKTSTRAFWSC
jgi:hypothetical protein